MFRILGNSTTTKGVVMFSHGFADSSDAFIINHPDRVMPFTLVREGYDVWLPNNRGNKHSMRHQWLDPVTDVEYWKQAIPFLSAEHDFPAFVRFIQKETGADKVSVIAHS